MNHTIKNSSFDLWCTMQQPNTSCHGPEFRCVKIELKNGLSASGFTCARIQLCQDLSVPDKCAQVCKYVLWLTHFEDFYKASTSKNKNLPRYD